jgi:hypothetical protein
MDQKWKVGDKVLCIFGHGPYYTRAGIVYTIRAIELYNVGQGIELGISLVEISEKFGGNSYPTRMFRNCNSMTALEKAVYGV